MAARSRPLGEQEEQRTPPLPGRLPWIRLVRPLPTAEGLIGRPRPMARIAPNSNGLGEPSKAERGTQQHGAGSRETKAHHDRDQHDHKTQQVRAWPLRPLPGDCFVVKGNTTHAGAGGKTRESPLSRPTPEKHRPRVRPPRLSLGKGYPSPNRRGPPWRGLRAIGLRTTSNDRRGRVLAGSG